MERDRLFALADSLVATANGALAAADMLSTDNRPELVPLARDIAAYARGLHSTAAILRNLARGKNDTAS